MTAVTRTRTGPRRFAPPPVAVGIAKRLFSALFVVLGVVVVVFLIQRIVSDPMTPYISPEMSSEEVDALREQLGFNRPLIMQFFAFLGGVVTFDFGNSRVYGMPVTAVILNAVPVTFTLVMITLLVAFVVGVVVGIIAAIRRGGWIDKVVMTASMLGQALPAFWLGVLLILLFSVTLGMLPSGGYGTWGHLVLPVIALGANSANQFARVVRAEMIEVLGRDYIRTAHAQGIGEGRIFFRHAFRNSLLPLVTVLGVQFSLMIAGTVIIETVFSIPGVSRLLYQSIMQGDYAVTQAIAIYAAVLVTLVNLLVDLSYSWLDPRIKFGEKK
ncbi:ABC transporter permease [Leucobacter sp. wl10]|uniref:ABC transporter permease n=1 Tax=Leucobacter sp. wl10 TaxID=2304677 RepID=UPI0013C2C7CE|nr:ABC transporter permease [Leucobacter sp. wl10]